MNDKAHTRCPEGIPPIAVIGMGNVLLGDDGFGPCVVGALEAQWTFPPQVELVDAGTPGLDLAALLCGRDAVIFIDAVAARAEPGELRIYREGELERALELRPRVSPHDPALAEALAIARLSGSGPQTVLLVGVVPECTDVGVGLSERVSGMVGGAAQAIVDVLAGWGAACHRRQETTWPELWWKADARASGAASDGGK